MFATKVISPGTYIGQYMGEEIDVVESERRIEIGKGNYIYHFMKGQKEYVIDAIESTCIIKYVNDSPKRYANCQMRRIDINGPALGLFAVKEILVGQELRYPYGDDPEKLWWRKHKQYVKPRFIKNGCPVVDSEFPICVLGNMANIGDTTLSEYSVDGNSGSMPICMVGNVADMGDAPSKESSVDGNSGSISICAVGNIADIGDAPSAESSVEGNSGSMPICIVGNVADMGDTPSTESSLDGDSGSILICAVGNIADTGDAPSAESSVDGDSGSMPISMVGNLADMGDVPSKESSVDSDSGSMPICMVGNVTDMGDAPSKESSVDGDSGSISICAVGNVVDIGDAPSAESSVDGNSGSMPICMVGNIADMGDAPSTESSLDGDSGSISICAVGNIADIGDAPSAESSVDSDSGSISICVVGNVADIGDAPSTESSVDDDLLSTKFDFSIASLPANKEIVSMLEEENEDLNDQDSVSNSAEEIGDSDGDSGVSMSNSLQSIEDVSFSLLRTVVDERSDDNDYDADYIPEFTDDDDDDDSGDEERFRSYLDEIILGEAASTPADEIQKESVSKTSEESESEDEDESEDENPEEVAAKLFAKKLQKMEKRHIHGHKGHNCIFCGKVYSKMPRHLEQKHSDEARVKDALSHPSGSKGRKEIWTVLRREGDFEISIQAMQENMKPCAVRIGKKASGDQLPCEYCKGFFDKRKISIHLKRCFRRKEDSKSSVKSSRILLAATLFDGKFSEVQQKIIPIIKDANLALIIRNDNLLLTLAGVELDKKDVSRYHDITYTLRTMAKVIIQFRIFTGDENMHAIDLVQPTNYDALIDTIKKLSGYVNSKKIDNPSLVLKIGYVLRRLTVLAKLMYVKSGSFEDVRKAEHMMTLYDEDYSNYANNARVLFEPRKGNAPEELPLESDMNKLRLYIVTQIKELASKETLSLGQLMDLTKLVYARLLIFNARRGGEPAKLTLDHWEKVLADTWKRESDLHNLTDPIEKLLAERLKLCYVQGKKKRKGEVFILSTDVQMLVLCPGGG